MRQAKRPNGAEAFRLLQVRFNPVTIGRQRAALIKITNPTAHVAIDKLSSEIVGWENKIVDYESRPGADKVSDAMKMAALVHMCPTKLQEHLQLNAGRFRSYLDLREEVFAYLDQVAPAASTTMDVGSLSKGCYNCGGPHLARDCPHPSQKGKGKGGKSVKGKGKDAGGGKKGKGKGGKDSGKDKSKGKGKSPCAVCGKTNHRTEQCWQKVKPLNAVDPKLSELQSQYARAALAEFQKTQNASGPQPPSAPASPVSPQTQSPPACSSANGKHFG